MTATPTFCFVIPCFNEEDNVGATVGSVRKAMGGRDDYEIILVNDLIKVTATNNGIKPRTHQVDTRRL
jgi:cellulose synthase/poly-beta-1,6-N-acetylglucosamine synthase-like glycosyltransferase